MTPTPFDKTTRVGLAAIWLTTLAMGAGGLWIVINGKLADAATTKPATQPAKEPTQKQLVAEFRADVADIKASVTQLSSAVTELSSNGHRKLGPVVYNFTGGRWQFGKPTAWVANGWVFGGTVEPDPTKLFGYVFGAAVSGGPLILDELYVSAPTPANPKATRYATNDEWVGIVRRTREMRNGTDNIGRDIRVALWNHPGVNTWNTYELGKGNPFYDGWAKSLEDYAAHPLAKETDVLMPGMDRDWWCQDLPTWRRKADAVLPAYQALAAKTGQTLIVSLSPCSDGFVPPDLNTWRAQLRYFGDKGVAVAVWVPVKGAEWAPYVQAVREFEQGR